MRRLLILAAVAAVAAATSGCRCGGLFRRQVCSVTSECSACCDDVVGEHEVYSDEFAPVWEESIPVPRAR
jgi:hypothetical protein